ncbi:hypothetical protein T01_1385 [Trichinella spiralis]|uniref:DUF7041 domain-containing protein n=1 Tax=Trichinella spiralis TaxID=6334 RepID=A0A0V1ASZ0_TRISP|nr:hypothetical protein T01_1385 [Trichinella spiralis]
MNDAGHPSSNAVSTTLTIPTFNTVDPELWFLGLDLFFQRQHIVDEVDELHMALTAMPDEAVAEFRDFLSNALNLPDPFTTFKQLCLKRTAQTKDQRILQALTNEELNDGKPSQFLRRLQRLLGGDSDDIVGSLFLSRFPLPIRTAFVPFQDRPLTERAELADQIAALQPTTVINAVVVNFNAWREQKSKFRADFPGNVFIRSGLRFAHNNAINRRKHTHSTEPSDRTHQKSGVTRTPTLPPTVDGRHSSSSTPVTSP